MLRHIFHRDGQRGETLLIAVISAALLGIGIAVAARSCSNQVESLSALEVKETAIDVANNLRHRMNCNYTIRANKGKRCKGLPVIGKGPSDETLFLPSGYTPYSDKMLVQGYINVVDNKYEINVRYKTVDMPDYQDLFAAPMVCDVSGQWVQSVAKNCSQTCGNIGLENIMSPDGNYCASGEMRPATANGQIGYPRGCWGGSGCSPNNYGPWRNGKWYGYAKSRPPYCYRPGDKMDNDSTDIQVGCYCGVAVACD